MSFRILPSLSLLPRAHSPLIQLHLRPASTTATPSGSTTAEVTSTTPGSHAHEQESYSAFSKRYVTFFSSVQDIFELQRGLNNCFAYDLVPSISVVEAALRAARRVDDYATAVRVFEGVREKVENKRQYEQYLEETKKIREELGITTKEELYE